LTDLEFAKRESERGGWTATYKGMSLLKEIDLSNDAKSILEGTQPGRAFLASLSK
jgi:hypothetical protein